MTEDAFTHRITEIHVNLAEIEAGLAAVGANIEEAENCLSQVKPSPWPWERPRNARLRNATGGLITRNRHLQARIRYLQLVNERLLLENRLGVRADQEARTS